MLVYSLALKQNYCIHLRVLVVSRASSYDSMIEISLQGFTSVRKFRGNWKKHIGTANQRQLLRSMLTDFCVLS